MLNVATINIAHTHCTKLNSIGRGGGPRAAEEDAAAGERPRPDPGEADERQPAPGGEGEGPAERES